MAAARRVAIGWALSVCACSSGAPSQPEPTKLSEESALVDPPRRPPAADRFADPEDDPPQPRTQPQIPAADIEAALAEAAGSVAGGKPQHAIGPLRRCANKVPASARCDGELGIVLALLGTQRAHMRYFLDEAARNDDPAADVGLYRRIADAARRKGRQTAVADAMRIVVSRGAATADDQLMLAYGLSRDAERVEEAIAALAAAYALAPDRHEILFRQAVLAARTPDEQRAIDLLQRFIASGSTDAGKLDSARQRLAALQARAATPPAQ